MWGDFQTTGGPGQPIGGQDTFVFGSHNGDDIIHDFSQAELDIIEIDVPTNGGGQFPQTFADLNIEVVGTDSVIHFDANNSVTVLGVTGLTAADFHFVV